MLKLIFTSVFIVLFSPLVFSQIDSNAVNLKYNNVSDTSVRQLTDSSKAFRDSINQIIEDLVYKSSGEKAKLKGIQHRIGIYIEKLNNIEDTLGILNINMGIKKDSLTRISTLLQTLSDSLHLETSNLNGITKNFQNKVDSISDFNTKIGLIRAELAKAEDSMQVIAKISLTNKNYVHLDRDGLVESFLQEKDSIRRISLLQVLGPDGFRLFEDSVLNRIAVNKICDSIPHNYKKRIKVLEVNIDVYEGVIREIIVKTNYGIYRNLESPIDLVNIGNRLDDHLPRDGEAKYKHEYLKLGEIIEYIPKRSFNDLPYTQFNITLIPDTTHRNESYWIRENTSINTYFDLAVFTDIKGISGEPNGLAQVNASAKFITRTRNVPGTAAIFFNYVSFVGGLAKFDNAFKGTTLLRGDSINRRDLLQRSNYNIGVKLNIVHGILSPLPRRLIHDLQINVGFNFIGSKVLKSFEKGGTIPKVLDTTYYTATHNQIYIEPLISFARFRNFNMAISLPVSLISLKKSTEIKNNRMEIWAKPSIELMYFSHRNSSNKIFFRYNHWINLKTNEDAYFQAQLGYSANISDLFSSK